MSPRSKNTSVSAVDEIQRLPSVSYCISKKPEVGQRGGVTIKFVDLGGGCGIFDDCDFESLLQKIAHVGLDAEIR